MIRWSALIPMGFVYLFSIFFFALIYTFLLPRDFYHSYVKLEPEMRELRSRVQRELMATIDEQLSVNPDLGNGIQFKLDYGLVIAEARDGVLTGSLEMGALLTRGTESGLYTTRLPILLSGLGLRAVEKPGAPRTMVEDAKDLKDRTRTVYIARDTEKPAQDHTILKHDSGDQASVTDALGPSLERIQLSDSERSGLFALLNVEGGFPADTEGTFGRMLYFSAVTITTVGYGDIVPLTPLGRFFAAVEATVGIVLLGVMVSKLTTK